MYQTELKIHKDKFLINNELIYSEIVGVPEGSKGMLMNARFIQGVFDDKTGRNRYSRFGIEAFDPQTNTEDLIKALPEWYKYGLRGITVGFQGGGPCFTIDNYTINNNPYSEDGRVIDDTYLERMEKIIVAADKIGMVVIVSLFYGAQTRFLKDRSAVIQAVKTASKWLKSKKFTNVIIEIANEQDVADCKIHDIIYSEEGMAKLINIAKEESGGMPVGCSRLGGSFSEVIAEASDVILIHGNDQTRQGFYNLIQKAKQIQPIRPIVCNEDSQAISRLLVAYNEQVSWGYYNNMTKQEPPVSWGVLDGEDRFFAMRMAKGLGIQIPDIDEEECFYVQGLEANMEYESKRWIRLASLYPEKVNYVEFYRNNTYFATAYDDPFSINFEGNWRQGPVQGIEVGEVWVAKIYCIDGSKIVKEVVVK